MCGIVRATNLIVSAFVGSISEVYTTIKSCFTIIRVIDGLFVLCHVKAKVCQVGRFVSLKADRCCKSSIYVVEGDLCRER